LHLVSFFNFTDLNMNYDMSYQYFSAARIFESISLLVIFSNINRRKKTSYFLGHFTGMSVLILSIVLISLGLTQEQFIPTGGITAARLITSYGTGIIFLITAVLVYLNNMDFKQKNLLVVVLILKAFAQLVHASFSEIGDVFQITAMLLRFLSYGGLYMIFIRVIVINPYKNVYSLFESKEQELLSLSQKDSLTGIYNHSLTFKNIENMILNMGKKYKDLCVILFDIDNFKQVNDSFGHIKGDEMLIAFTALLDDIDFNDRMLGRYGGDEFVLAIPNCTEKDIPDIFMKLNSSLLEIAEKTGVLITFSSGVVFWHIGDNATDLIRKADIKMYESKNKGKNQYTIWQQDYNKK